MQVTAEPAAKFYEGQLVKMDIGDEWYYNHVVDSYFNREVNMRMYRLSEQLAMPIYREDWLEPVSDDELKLINNSGKLKQKPRGGWHHPYFDQEVTK